MSLVLMVFYWMVIPLGVFQLARWLFGRTQSPVKKGLVLAGTLGFFAWFLWVAVGRNMWLDHQVRGMCAKDGGINVYEIVTVPPERFDKYGQVRVPFKEFAKPEDEYFYEGKNLYLVKGNPEIWRSNYRMIRRHDSKVMGEVASYHRRGGGLLGPWADSSFGCPKDASTNDLAKQIFNKAK